jgi:hypothetical protein
MNSPDTHDTGGTAADLSGHDIDTLRLAETTSLTT